MATIADVNAGNELTGSGTQDPVYTAGAGLNKAAGTLILYNKAGATRTVKLYLNGMTTDYQIRNEITILTLEHAEVDFVVGPSDVLYAEASAASSIQWIVIELEDS